MLHVKMYMAVNDKYINYILNNSPHLFGPGKLKYEFFETFMSKNLGVSTGCPWKYLREKTEIVLSSEKLHAKSQYYHYLIILVRIFSCSY